jgi:hypothetical protein
MQPRFQFCKAAILIFSALVLLISCGGGGGGGGGGGSSTSQITLSSSQAQPGQFITIYHESIEAGSIVEVAFKVAGGYEVRAETGLTGAGEAKIAVPVNYERESSQFGSGDVEVSVGGVASSASLAITELPHLEEGMRGGDLAIFMMQTSIKEYTQLLENIQTMAVETGGEADEEQAVLSILTRISTLDDMIWEIETFGELTIETEDGQMVLSGENLEMVDRLLLASIMGMSDALNFTATLPSSDTALQQASPLEGVPQHIKDRIKHVIDETKRGFEGGNVLLAGTSIVVVIGGLVLSAPYVAAAGGIALVYAGVTWDFGSGAISEKLTDAFVEKGGYVVDWGKKAVKSLIRIGTEFVSAGGSKLAQALAVLQDALQLHESAEKVVCEDVQAQKAFALDAAPSCPSGYIWNTQVGKCIQENCYDIPNAHYSYTLDCVCGSSGSIYEDPSDPNRECSLPFDDPSCPGCVYACVYLDEECPGTMPGTDTELIEFCMLVLAPQ